jgi:hypothetical protein
MKHLFPLLEARFNGDKQLKKVARNIYRGFEGQPLRSHAPYVEISTSGVENSDTFDAHIDIYTLDFTAFTKGGEPDRIDDILFELRRVFKDAGSMASSEFTVVGFEMTGQVGPLLNEGFFKATVTYQAYIHWTKKRPATEAA